ncbi:hypothetical protein RCZ04_21160 [Capnocytophaga sp. HP1101]
MKYLTLYLLLLCLTGCQLFQSQQPAEQEEVTSAITTEVSEEPKLTEKELLETMGNESDTKTFNQLFTIEKISEQEYLQALKYRYDFLVKDNGIKKQQGVITLPCKNRTVTLEDTEASENDGDAERYDYLGEAPALNQYVVRYTVYRAEQILFIDKQTGNQTEIEGEAFISPDNNYVMNVYSNGMIMFLTLYKVNKSPSLNFKELATVYPSLLDT